MSTSDSAEPEHGRTGFRLLATAYVVSQLGSAMSLVTLPLIVFMLTGSAVQTGILGVIEVLPYLLLGLFAGTLADRVPGRLIPAVTDVVSAAGFGALALALALTTLPVWVVYVAAALGSVCFVFHSSPFPVLTRRLVGRAGIVRASSVLQLADTATAVAGAALAGILVTTTSPELVVALDAVSFLVSALLIAAIRLPSGPVTPAKDPATRPHWREELKTGVRFFWMTRDLRNAIMAALGMVITGGALLSMLTPFAGQALGASAHGPDIALLYAAGNLGSAIAAAALPLLHKRVPAGRLALYGLAGNAVAYALLMGTPTWETALPIMVMWQLTYTLVIVNNGAIRHFVTPIPLLGRVSATARMLAWGGAPLGAATASALSAVMSVRSALAWCGLGVALGLAWAVAGRVGAIDVHKSAAAADATEVAPLPAAGSGGG